MIFLLGFAVIAGVVAFAVWRIHLARPPAELPAPTVEAESKNWLPSDLAHDTHSPNAPDSSNDNSSNGGGPDAGGSGSSGSGDSAPPPARIPTRPTNPQCPLAGLDDQGPSQRNGPTLVAAASRSGPTTRYSGLFAGEDLADPLPQFVVDRGVRPFSADDREPVDGLQPTKRVAHRGLIFEEAVEHVPRKPQVHAAFPIVQGLVLSEDPLHQLFRGHFQIEDRIGNEGDAVKVSQPALVHAPDQVTRHQGVNVAIGQDHHAGPQGH